MMRSGETTVVVRVLCAVTAVLVGWLALSVGYSGEFRSKTGVVQLGLLGRCLITGLFGTMSLVAAWVAVRGRA